MGAQVMGAREGFLANARTLPEQAIEHRGRA